VDEEEFESGAPDECPSHPGEIAEYQCGSCGKSFCEKCMAELGGDKLVCPHCALLLIDLTDLMMGCRESYPTVRML
jgi:hypothetical protein